MGKDPSLIEPRVKGLVMLSAVVFPAVFLDQQAFGGLLVIVEIVEKENVLRAVQDDVSHERRDRNQRKVLQPLAGELLIYARDVEAVEVPLRPLANVDSLGSKVDSAHAIVHGMPAACAVE